MQDLKNARASGAFAGLQPPHSDSRRTAAFLADVERLASSPCAGCHRPLCGHEGVIAVVLGYKDKPQCLACIAASMDEDAERLRMRVWQYVRRHDCFMIGWRWADRCEGFSEEPLDGEDDEDDDCGEPPCLVKVCHAARDARSIDTAVADPAALVDGALAQETGGDRAACETANEGAAGERAVDRPACEPAVEAAAQETADDRAACEPGIGRAARENAVDGVARDALADRERWNAGDMACGDLVLELRRRLDAMAPGRVLELTAYDKAAPVDIPAWCGLTRHRLVDATPPVYLIQRKEN